MGLQTWITTPHTPKYPHEKGAWLPKAAISKRRVQGARDALVIGCIEVMSRYEGIRLVELTKFFEKIFIPLGGFKAVGEAFTRPRPLPRQRRSAAQEVKYLVEIAAILHYQAIHFSDEARYGQLTVPIANGAYRKFGQQPAGVTTRQVQTYLGKYLRALPFLYAGAHTRGRNNGLLLDELLTQMLSGDVSHFLSWDAAVFKEWAGKASYFNDSVLEKVEMEAPQRFHFGETIERIAFSEPQYSVEQKAKLDLAIRNSPGKATPKARTSE